MTETAEFVYAIIFRVSRIGVEISTCEAEIVSPCNPKWFWFAHSWLLILSILIACSTSVGDSHKTIQRPTVVGGIGYSEAGEEQKEDLYPKSNSYQNRNQMLNGYNLNLFDEVRMLDG